ncbi:hypothetical protein F511_11397 [Dorcoceras hygrometricum]|uniref:Uncharacterized protein n=1 Tax=Dorcoceras hygrometricum TaxID=472368 RepID=A0A2Z7ACA6_9LAMI|nr:hypothetical protein F511_11397 [Dorcoceras hygrometricum]
MIDYYFSTYSRRYSGFPCSSKTQTPLRTRSKTENRSINRGVEHMEQIASALNRVANSNAVLNTLLAGALAALAMRSMVQQRSVEALEAEKDALLESNKIIKKTIWNWKQLLYAEAEANPPEALVPLSTLKAIYGEVSSSAVVAVGDDNNQGGKKIMI